MQKKTLTVGAARISYRTEGAGPALVLVHGAGPGSVMWDGLLGRFTDRHTVILPDLAGGDGAEDDGAPLTVEALAAQVIAVIEDSGAGPVDLVGFSLGAPVAAATAALRPDLVRRVDVRALLPRITAPTLGSARPTTGRCPWRTTATCTRVSRAAATRSSTPATW